MRASSAPVVTSRRRDRAPAPPRGRTRGRHSARLADDELRARLGAAGPPFVRANYDRAAVMRQFAQTVLALPRFTQ